MLQNDPYKCLMAIRAEMVMNECKDDGQRELTLPVHLLLTVIADVLILQSLPKLRNQYLSDIFLDRRVHVFIMEDQILKFSLQVGLLQCQDPFLEGYVLRFFLSHSLIYISMLFL